MTSTARMQVKWTRHRDQAGGRIDAGGPPQGYDSLVVHFVGDCRWPRRTQLKCTPEPPLWKVSLLDEAWLRRIGIMAGVVISVRQNGK